MRDILTTPRFERKLRSFLRKNPELSGKVQRRLELLQKNVHDPLLRTHALTGKLRGSWAASITYEYRLIFSFDSTTITLEAIGTHDEVY